MENQKTYLFRKKNALWLLFLVLTTIVIMGSIIFLVFSENGLLTQTKKLKRSAPEYLTTEKTQAPLTATVWQPTPGTTWQWQLTDTIDTSYNVQMYDIDLFDAPQSKIDQLKADGRIVICYFSAGSWENWRADANKFPASVKGRNNGWPGEKWLDIRQLDILGPIMESRMDLAVQKKCNGIEPDNIDGWDGNNTGFPLTANDQLTYNRWLATQAHERNLSIGLKNDLGQINQLVGNFDWALDEECFEYDECEALLPFISAGKAVFHVEYNVNTSFFCPQANTWGFSSMKKRLDLDAWMEPCWNIGADTDADNDGYEDTKENYMGTNPQKACPNTSTANDEPIDAWPPDLDDNQFINILDVTQLTPPVFDSKVGDPNYSKRKDLNADGVINMTDLYMLLPPFFGLTCTP